MDPEARSAAHRPSLVAIPILVLAVSLALTGQIWRTAVRTNREHARQTTERIGGQVRDTLVERFAAQEVALNGLRAIFAASRSVERAEWRSFVESHRVRSLHRASLGFCSIARVEDSDLRDFIARARKDDAPDFEVHIPEGGPGAPPGTEHAIVLYHEPADLLPGLTGLDLAGIPAISTALWTAARRGELTISEPVAEIAGLRTPVAWVCLPIYRRGAPDETAPQRLAALIGWVAMPLRITEMMQELAATEPRLGFELHAGPDLATLVPLYRSHPGSDAESRHRIGNRITFGGRLWSLYAFDRGLGEGRTNIAIPIAGLCISVLLAGVIWSLLRTRGRAIELAARMTASLRESQRELSVSLESEEQARRDADAASRAKSEFLANMSHEIRTPMTAILGFSELLLEGNPTDEERRRHLITIRRNGEHLLSIINDILDLSKIESGRLDVEAMPVRIRSLVDEVVVMFGVRAGEKGIELSLEFDPDIPLQVRTDPVRLRQVIVNLVGNAVKFTERGSVRLSVERVPDDPTRLRFTVTDTGIGIATEKLADIFQPFQQADSSTTRNYGGTGLGLAISSRLVAMLGGTIAVRSTPGTGSTFEFTIRAEEVPWTDAGEIAARAPAAAARVGLRESRQAGRILLAEDGPDNQRLIGLILQNAGYAVDIVENGREALDRALSDWRDGDPYDTILMDMQMPEMDGYTATRLLREEGYDGRIVALTAHAMQKDRERCLAAGCDEFASKPIDRKAILEIVGRASAPPAAPAPEREGETEGVV